MCIRDSGITRAFKNTLFHDKLQGGSTITQQLVKTALLTPCLLYTSDAADERSSVDLGGRRIIKKKKHEDNHTRTISTKRKNNTHVLHKVNKKNTE